MNSPGSRPSRAMRSGSIVGPVGASQSITLMINQLERISGEDIGNNQATSIVSTVQKMEAMIEKFSNSVLGLMNECEDEAARAITMNDANRIRPISAAAPAVVEPTSSATATTPMHTPPIGNSPQIAPKKARSPQTTMGASGPSSGGSGKQRSARKGQGQGGSSLANERHGSGSASGSSPHSAFLTQTANRPTTPSDVAPQQEIVLQRTSFQAQREAELASSLAGFRKELQETVTRCLDDHLAQTRASLLHHRKRIQEKLWVTRESIALGKEADERANKQLREEAIRIVRTQLEDKFDREMGIKKAEIDTLTYNNRIMNQKITDCLEESRKHVETIADLQLKLSPFLKAKERKVGVRKTASRGGMGSTGGVPGSASGSRGLSGSPNPAGGNTRSGSSHSLSGTGGFARTMGSTSGLLGATLQESPAGAAKEGRMSTPGDTETSTPGLGGAVVGMDDYEEDPMLFSSNGSTDTEEPRSGRAGMGSGGGGAGTYGSLSPYNSRHGSPKGGRAGSAGAVPCQACSLHYRGEISRLQGSLSDALANLAIANANANASTSPSPAMGAEAYYSSSSSRPVADGISGPGTGRAAASPTLPPSIQSPPMQSLPPMDDSATDAAGAVVEQQAVVPQVTPKKSQQPTTSLMTAAEVASTPGSASASLVGEAEEQPAAQVPEPAAVVAAITEAAATQLQVPPTVAGASSTSRPSSKPKSPASPGKKRKAGGKGSRSGSRPSSADVKPSDSKEAEAATPQAKEAPKPAQEMTAVESTPAAAVPVEAPAAETPPVDQKAANPAAEPVNASPAATATPATKPSPQAATPAEPPGPVTPASAPAQELAPAPAPAPVPKAVPVEAPPAVVTSASTAKAAPEPDANRESTKSPVQLSAAASLPSTVTIPSFRKSPTSTPPGAAPEPARVASSGDSVGSRQSPLPVGVPVSVASIPTPHQFTDETPIGSRYSNTRIDNLQQQQQQNRMSPALGGSVAPKSGAESPGTGSVAAAAAAAGSYQQWEQSMLQQQGSLSASPCGSVHSSVSASTTMAPYLPSNNQAMGMGGGIPVSAMGGGVSLMSDSATIATLVKQKEENEMLIKLLQESATVQAELQGVVSSLESQNTSLLAKIHEDEETIAVNANLYRLQLKERGLLLRELATEVNTLRSFISRDKSMVQRSKVTVPLKSNATGTNTPTASASATATITNAVPEPAHPVSTQQLNALEPRQAVIGFSNTRTSHTDAARSLAALPSTIPHHEALMQQQRQQMQGLGGRPTSGGALSSSMEGSLRPKSGGADGMVWVPNPKPPAGAGAAGAMYLSASCSSLPLPATGGTGLLTGATASAAGLPSPNMRSLYEASGGAFGAVDLAKQQEESEFQAAILKLPWHKRLQMLKERKEHEEAEQAAKVRMHQLRENAEAEAKLMEAKQKRASKRATAAALAGGCSASDALSAGAAAAAALVPAPDSPSNSATHGHVSQSELFAPSSGIGAGLANTLGGGADGVDQYAALLSSQLGDSKKAELKAIRNQIAVILAEKIGPKKQKLLAVHQASEEKLRSRKLFMVKAVKGVYGGGAPDEEEGEVEAKKEKRVSGKTK